MSNAKLAMTCSLAHGETATSFASRLAIRNMTESAEEFCLDMGLTWQALIRGDEEDVSCLADLGDVDQNAYFGKHSGFCRVKSCGLETKS